MTSRPIYLLSAPLAFSLASVTLALAVLVLCAPFAIALAAPRDGYYALIIGNGGYARDEMVLGNPVNDARAVRDVFKKLGFHVTYGENLSYEETHKKIRAFFKSSGKSKKVKIAVFYYAGHGIQINERNFMVPVDATFQSGKVNRSVISLTNMVEYINKRSDAGLIFLDACRNNPFADEIRSGVTRGTLKLTRSLGQFDLDRGFKQLMGKAADDGDDLITSDKLQIGKGLAKIETGLGMFIAYATSPGDVALDGKGRHSPYTEGLLKFIRKRGLHITEIMSRVRNHVARRTREKQIPWDSSSLRSDVFLQRVASTAKTRTSRRKPTTTKRRSSTRPARRSSSAPAAKRKKKAPMFLP